MAIDPLGRPATVLRPYDAQPDTMPLARLNLGYQREKAATANRRQKLDNVKALDYWDVDRPFFQKMWDDVQSWTTEQMNKGIDPFDEANPANREANQKLNDLLRAMEETANASKQHRERALKAEQIEMSKPDGFDLMTGQQKREAYAKMSPLERLQHKDLLVTPREEPFDVNKFIRDNVTNLEGATVTTEAPNVAAGVKTTTVRLPKEKIDNRWVIMEDAMRQGNVPDEQIEKAKTDFYSSFGKKDQTELLPKSDEWSYGDGSAKGKGIVAKRGTYTIGGTNSPGASETPQGGAAPGAVKAQAIELSGDGKNIPAQSISFNNAVRVKVKSTGDPIEINTTTVDDFVPLRIYKTPYGKIFVQGTGKYEEKGVLKSGQMEFEVDSNNKQMVETKWLPGTVDEFFDKTEQKKTTSSTPTKAGEDDYIKSILTFEKNKGYDNYGFTSEPKGSIKSIEQAAQKFKQEYLPMIKDLPLPLQAVAGDFAFNSEDPRASLMVAAGFITPEEKKKLYVNGKLDKTKVDKLWNVNGDGGFGRVGNEYAGNPQGFLDAFDKERIRSYENTKGADQHLREWKERVVQSRQVANKLLNSKTATKAQIKSLVWKPGYEGYTEQELIDYYKSQGYEVE